MSITLRGGHVRKPGCGLCWMPAIGLCLAFCGCSAGGGSMAGGDADRTSAAAAPAGSIPDRDESAKLEAMNAELVELGERLFSAIRQNRQEAIQETVLDPQQLDRWLKSLSFSNPSEAERTSKNLHRALESLPEELQRSLTRTSALAAKAGINWETVTVVTINPHGKQLADRLPFDTFKGIHIDFEDSRLPGQRFRLSLGGGVHAGEHWRFASTWEGPERLDVDAP